MTDRQYSELPAGPLSGGPVLCMDIDGVASPVGQNQRFDVDAPTPGFVPVPRVSYPVHVHPALPAWMDALEQAFRTLRLGIELAGAVPPLCRSRGAPGRGQVAVPDAGG